MLLLIFAETIIQVDSMSLITGLGAAGTALGGGIVAAAKLIISVVTKLHNENRADRTELMKMVSGQWEQLSRLAQSSRVTAQAVRSVQKKVGAKPVPADEPFDEEEPADG